MVTKEQLESRLAQLKEQKEKNLAFIHVLDGAMQDCEHWLAELAKESK